MATHGMALNGIPWHRMATCGTVHQRKVTVWQCMTKCGVAVVAMTYSGPDQNILQHKICTTIQHVDLANNENDDMLVHMCKRGTH
jgi:hypothetical protein